MKVSFYISTVVLFGCLSSEVFAQDGEGAATTPASINAPNCLGAARALTEDGGDSETRHYIKSHLRSDTEKREFAESVIHIKPFSRHTGFYSVRGTYFISNLNRQSRPLPRNIDWRSYQDVSRDRLLSPAYPAILLDMNIRKGKEVETHDAVVGYSLEALIEISKVSGLRGLLKLHSSVTEIPEDQIPDQALNIFRAISKADPSHPFYDPKSFLSTLCETLKNRSDFSGPLGKDRLRSISENKIPTLFSPSDSDQSMIFLSVYSKPKEEPPRRTSARADHSAIMEALLAAPDLPPQSGGEIRPPQIQASIELPQKFEITPQWAQPRVITRPIRTEPIKATALTKPVEIVVPKVAEVVETISFDENKLFALVDEVRALVTSLAMDGNINLHAAKRIVSSEDWAKVSALIKNIEEAPIATIKTLHELLTDDSEFVGVFNGAFAALSSSNLLGERNELEILAKKLGYESVLRLEIKATNPVDVFKSKIVGISSERADSVKQDIFESLFADKSGTTKNFSDLSGRLVFHSKVGSDLAGINSAKVDAISKKIIGLGEWVKLTAEPKLPGTSVPISSVKGISMVNPGGVRLYVSVDLATRKILVVGMTDQDDHRMEKTLAARFIQMQSALLKSGK